MKKKKCLTDVHVRNHALVRAGEIKELGKTTQIYTSHEEVKFMFNVFERFTQGAGLKVSRY